MKHDHQRRCTLPFRTPCPPLGIVLVAPEIPPNTGNIARLCAATGSRLHLVEPLGFKLTNAHLRRAGLDYWDSVDLVRHDSWQEYLDREQPARMHLFSTTGKTAYTGAGYQAGDALVFGSEGSGLPAEILAAHPEQVLGIPIRTDHVRSLNLANAVSIALYEALRQLSPGAP